MGQKMAITRNLWEEAKTQALSHFPPKPDDDAMLTQEMLAATLATTTQLIKQDQIKREFEKDKQELQARFLNYQTQQLQALQTKISELQPLDNQIETQKKEEDDENKKQKEPDYETQVLELNIKITEQTQRLQSILSNTLKTTPAVVTAPMAIPPETANKIPPLPSIAHSDSDVVTSPMPMPLEVVQNVTSTSSIKDSIKDTPSKIVSQIPLQSATPGASSLVITAPMPIPPPLELSPINHKSHSANTAPSIHEQNPTLSNQLENMQENALNGIFKLASKDALTKSYKKTKTERFAKGILQKINNAIGHSHSKMREEQIKHIDNLVLSLKSSAELTAQEKGMILHGAFEKIAQDIHAENNKFKSRFEDLCHRLQQDLKGIGLPQTDSKVTQKLYQAYQQGGTPEFKKESIKLSVPNLQPNRATK